MNIEFIEEIVRYLNIIWATSAIVLMVLNQYLIQRLPEILRAPALSDRYVIGMSIVNFMLVVGEFIYISYYSLLYEVSPPW